MITPLVIPYYLRCVYFFLSIFVWSSSEVKVKVLILVLAFNQYYISSSGVTGVQTHRPNSCADQ